jgi:FMN hydrolase / 5-amino-6-(5-phospho-D-ribitylamino)uracil phosphatase
MITPRVISLDLDDTLWSVGPVIAAAEAVLLAWLRERHPKAAHGHDVESMRAMRMRIAAQFPEQSHDMTFLRRRALEEQFARAGYPILLAQETRNLSRAAASAVGSASPSSVNSASSGASASPGAAAAAASSLASPIEEALEIFFVERNRVELYDDVRPALTRLRAEYRLFAVSNGNADLGRCGIADLFDGHVTASAVGAAKPDAKIFAHLRELAGVERSEIMHIGDDPLADVIGATRAGMQAVWLNREGHEWPQQFAPPPRTISTLAEIM